MKISLVTPVYNSASTLARTMNSVLAQNYPDLEYIIMDGASTDNTKEIVAGYAGKLNIKFISESDKGIYDAMNKGVRLATGDIIGILNSDDFYDKNEVLKTVAEAFADQKTEAVYGDIKYFGTDANKITRYWQAGEYTETKFNNGWMMPHPTLFVLKSVYDKCGLYNTDLKLAADYEFILRLLKIHKIEIKYIPRTLVQMYNGGASGKSFKQRIKGWQEDKLAWKINSLKVPRLFILRRVISKLSQFLFKA
jgi:glycosyltransferase involved in cell wall biosynthesis